MSTTSLLGGQAWTVLRGVTTSWWRLAREPRSATPGAPRSLAASASERRHPGGQVGQGEPVQVPRAPARHPLGLGPPEPGELPLEAQPREVADHALTQRA